jgi:hypothetical protein
MPIRPKYNWALVVIFAVCIVLMGAAVALNHPAWAAPVPILLFAFGVWGNTLKCSSCGAPYLYEIKFGLLYPKTFPKYCRKCGHTVE